MKKRALSIFIALSILFSGLVPVGAYAATADTDIGSWEELLAFASTVNGGDSYAGKTVRLTADVAAPSGAEWSGINGFAGTFDGQGHTVSGLRMNNAAESGTGFFNTTAAGATIRDLAIADSSFTGAARTGALVGDVTGALSVSGVWVKDDVTLESSARLGGLIGNTSANVSLSNCAVDADLAITAVGGWAYGYAGGMIGWVHSGAAATITGCAYVGKLTRTGGDFFGGMVGHVYGNASRHGTVTVQTSVAAPDLSGVGGHAGGFVGGSQAESYVDLQIVNDYSGVAAIVGDGLSERILTESPNYWTPASSVNGNTRWVAFPAQLRGFALASRSYNFAGRTLLMTRDLDLSFWGDWPMLGSPDRGFAGTFDGGNFAVSGLTVTIDSETDVSTGFVSLLDGTLRNLTIRASGFVNNTSFTGAAVGRVRNSAKVRNVHIASDVLVQGFQQVGGVVGKMNGTQAGCTVENCWSEANVKLAPGGMTLSCAAGGVVGMAQHPNPVIAHCLFTGTLDSGVGVGGGILGGTMDSGVKTHVKISDCVSTGTLQGDVVGTILGAFDNAQTSDDPASPSFPQTYSILNCYGVGEKVVGALTVPFGRFDDDWTENSAAYPDAEKLYGGACRALNGAYWVFRTDGAPALKSFSTAPAYEEISDAASLLAFAAAVNGGDSYAGKTVRLTADIADVGAWSGVNGFAGTFEGGGHTVSGLTVSSDAETGAGFFNTTAAGAVIRDLTIANSTFTAPARAGALVGSAAGSLTASNVRVSGDVTVTSAARLGGLVGNTEGGAVVSLENCSSQASLTVSGSTVYGYAGGLVGWVHAGASVTAAGCLYAGAVTASGGSYYGGIAGHIHGNEGSHGSVTVQSSVALPELSGAAGRKGGFVGGAQAPDYVDVTLINSYSGYSPAVDTSVAGRIVNDSPTYWTPAAANGAVCAVGYEAQLYGLALASKSDNFSGLTLTLSRDMDLADRGEWPVLGSADRAFAGTFDGGGHTISGLSVSLDDGSSDSTVLRAGFIGDLSGTVRDLTISESSFICAAHFAGGVAGRVMGGTVQNVRVSDTVYVQSEHQVGGIAGSLNFGGTISGCLSQARVVQTGNSYDPGGIVGTVRHTGNTVAHCLFSGALRGADDSGCAGGLVGWVPATVNVAITDCVSTGTYTGASRYGGAIGCNDGSYTITNCFVSHAARYVGSEDPGTATGSAFYPSAWQLKGTGACAGLSGEYWMLSENAVPALKAYTTVPGIAETPLMSRETLADMPAADANDVEQYTLDGMPYLGVYSRHY
ncbi:MAG: hypothetical protein IJU18_02715, partial [Oscillospiraceae bacterium]|nr:hypothetical protein [Oscillospiraceae bacterium]